MEKSGESYEQKYKKPQNFPKVEQTLKYKDFLKELKQQLHTLKDHFKRAHTQFSAFKQARLEAKNNPDVVTIHID